eukprot:jgi/Psemu1/20165/gm1.20165_g
MSTTRTAITGTSITRPRPRCPESAITNRSATTRTTRTTTTTASVLVSVPCFVGRRAIVSSRSRNRVRIDVVVVAAVVAAFSWFLGGACAFCDAFMPFSAALCHRHPRRPLAATAAATETAATTRYDPSSPTNTHLSTAAIGIRTATATGTRGYCPRCKRPGVVCICHALPDAKIDCGTRILILQHPREAKKRKRTSTVPLIGLSIHHVEICVGTKFERGSHPLLDEALIMAERDRTSSHSHSHSHSNKDDGDDGSGRALLLYPSERAMPLQTYLEETETVTKTKSAHTGDARTNANANATVTTTTTTTNNILVVLDGTWAQTQSMVQNSYSLLRNLPFVMFDDETDSLFDSLRQEPAPHCTSTLEAIARAIRLLGSSSNNNDSNDNSNARKGADFLEQSLRAMVDGQLRFAMDKNTARPRYCRKDGNSDTNGKNDKSDDNDDNNNNNEATTSGSNKRGRTKRAQKRNRKIVSKRRSADLRLPTAKTEEEIELDRIRFVYIAHMG